jgi:plastocyanin
MIKKISAGLYLAIVLTACNQANSQNQVTGSSKAATNINAANAPAMKFETETHDFGKIKQGDKITYEFNYTNTGKSPLIISDAYATCGCTTPEFDKAPIQPGASSKIKVTFNSAGKSGLQDKLVTVVANTVPAENRVHLTGEVKADEKPVSAAEKK